MNFDLELLKTLFSRALSTVKDDAISIHNNMFALFLSLLGLFNGLCTPLLLIVGLGVIFIFYMYEEYVNLIEEIENDKYHKDKDNDKES